MHHLSKSQSHSTMLRESTNNSRKWLKKVSYDPVLALGVLLQFMYPSHLGKSECVNNMQLHSVTKKDSYQVPRAEGHQQKLAGKKVCSKLDLQSAYWQFPMEPQSVEKITSCPQPGYRLWKFTRMPYGLTGTTQTCQRGLENILQNYKYCVDNYNVNNKF